MASKLNTNDFIEKARIIHGDKYDYSKVEYVNSITKVTIICPEHGEFEQLPGNHTCGQRCFKCGRRASINSRMSSTVEFIEKATIVHGDKYDYSKTEYVHNKQKLTIICREHGVFLQTPNCHLKGNGCPICGKMSQHSGMFLSLDEFVEKSICLHGDKYDYSNVEYIHNKLFVKIVCKKHGMFEQKPQHHLRGQGCRRCAVSSCHMTILNILNDFDIEINDRKVLEGRELDIFIPSENIGIEINGCYWHGHRKNKKLYGDPRNDENFSGMHVNKLKLAKDKNITLLQFWDHEINNKTDIVKSMILHRLKRSNKIYARSLKIISCDNSHISDFMNKSHLQGHRNASVNYALIQNDEIVAVLNFSKHSKHEWEIIRYVCKLNHAIIGGFSKLLTRFKNDYNPNQIMTFADARYSVGGVYSSNGFEVIDHTDPNYFYVKNGDILSRQQCQKHKLHKFLPNFKYELSETDNMLEYGYTKVYDAGHTKLIWNKNNANNGS